MIKIKDIFSILSSLILVAVVLALMPVMFIVSLFREKATGMKYTLKHWFYYQITARKLNAWRPRHLLHDLDKVLMKTMVAFLSISVANKAIMNYQKVHRDLNRHHIGGRNPIEIDDNDYIDAIIDWECARYTKPDKPLNARQTLDKYYPEHKVAMESVFIKLGL